MLSRFASLRSVAGRLAVARPAVRVMTPFRSYAVDAHAKEAAAERVFDILESYAKITDPSKITLDASFTTDLHLDSLDVAEVVMQLEEEFSIEIPDEEIDEITTVGGAVDYVLRQPDAV
uniref:Acyl carrier protein n=2 Tax=Diutina rugosa TaxID=5481 RepID=Q9HFN7_DIURU|nr:putative acyl carrier protein [Diutina rugosa]